MMSGWTDERVELLKKLWGEGLSASDVAMRIGGLTRNAVIGKVHRLGLHLRGSGERRSRSRDTRAATLARRRKSQIERRENQKKRAESLRFNPEPYAPPPPRVFDQAKFVTFEDLEPHHCHWPVGDPATPELRFCGEKKVIGLSYCAECARHAYVPPKRRSGVPQIADGGVSAYRIVPDAFSSDLPASGVPERETEDA